MKVTTQLIEYMTIKRRQNNWSYAEMARRSGLSWEFFRKIESVLVLEIKQHSVDGICKLLQITEDELRSIANGNKKVTIPPSNPDVRAAEALLRWIRKDERRGQALRAMGYKGDL